MIAGKLQSEKVTGTSPDGKGVKVEGKILAKIENAVDATPVGSGALHLEPESAFQLTKAAVRECCFFRDTFTSALQDLHEL